MSSPNHFVEEVHLFVSEYSEEQILFLIVQSSPVLPAEDFHRISL